MSPNVALRDRPSGANLGQQVVAAHDLAARLPALLSAARRLAATQLHGVHSRRRAGPGEDFWQYRRYSFGEPASSIDWRRSGRSDSLFVREKEWQATQSFWFWIDLSKSMLVQSSLAQRTKLDAGLITLFAIADRLVDMNERVGLLGRTNAMASRNIATRLAQAMPMTLLDNSDLSTQLDALPPATPAPRFSDCVLIGDFLDDIDVLMDRFIKIASEGTRLHLLQILDPIEETFPFTGRTRFVDPETGAELVAGRAESFARTYKWTLELHKTRLRDEARARGWTYRIHHTATPLATMALPLLLNLVQAPGGRAGSRG